MVILAPVDNSEKAENVLKEAAALARAFDEQVHVLHVLSRSDFVDLERTNVNQTGNVLDINEVKETAKEIAEVAAASLDIDGETVGVMGNPKDEILQYATENNVRYIVLGPRKRSPAGKAIFGSVTQSVLLNSKCPVVVVTHDGNK